MNPFTFLKSALRHPALHLSVGLGLLVVSGVLLYGHAQAIAETRSVSVPLLAELPTLERTAAVLKEQSELSELESATRVGSQMERVRTYVLPEKSDLDRIIAVFEILRETLGKRGTLSKMSDITFEDPITREDGSIVRPLTVTFALHEDALHDMAALLRLSGLMTVGDALTQDEIAVLLDRTEAENPSGIVALEHFLSTDLLSYSQNTRLAEERLLRSFTSTTFVQSLQNVTRTSLLRDATEVLGGDIGAELTRYELWPLQMLSTDSVTLAPGSVEGWYTASFRVLVHQRAS